MPVVGARSSKLTSDLTVSCVERQVQLREVVLEDNDVPKALLDYIYKNCIQSIIVGASTRNALSRSLSLSQSIVCEYKRGTELYYMHCWG